MDTKQTAELNRQLHVTDMEGKYLTFWTGGQLYGVPIEHVVQIVVMQDITPMPDCPHYMKGIINLRGAIIPVIDMGLRLGKATAEYNERTCIIVSNIGDRHVGMIVDNVDEVTEIPDDIISPAPQSKTAGQSYVLGIAKLEGKMALLMELYKVLNEDDIETLSKI